MPTLNDPKFMRAIIMDHYQYPHNKKKVTSKAYTEVHMDSPNCIDDIFVFLKVSNKGIIDDIAFDGVACTISTASTSIMTDLVKGKSVKEAYKIIENYENMIFEKPYDKEILKEAIVFQNTYKQANRIKCATIGWNGLKEAIKLELDKQTGGNKK
jgi:nitrogen fixation NifU-like protein